jgi:hypothetical protein
VKNKASELNDISNKILHRIVYATPALLRNIFQACLNLRIQPTRWKEASIVIIRKPDKPDYTDSTVYRLIALFNTLEKAFEAIVAKRIRFLAETHALLPSTQMGARKQRSVDTALHLLFEKIYTVWAGNKPKIVTLLSIDVASVFDKVSYARFTHNLKRRKISAILI